VDDFNRKMEKDQVAWRKNHIQNQRPGTQNGKTRAWILPASIWEEGLWKGIRSSSDHSLQSYLGTKIQKHGGVHNLKSSWVVCANLYFPFQRDLPMLAGFLSERVATEIQSVDAVELEYAAPAPLDPQTLLGEPDTGRRGANQTSPDVAFRVRTASGPGLVLTENKFVEHSFYPCSGRKSEVENPAKHACMDLPTLLADLPGRCWQMRWQRGPRKNRLYWNHLQLSDHARRILTRCPAATAGYQLFRQQALAEGIAASAEYALVVSCVAYDTRNDTLVHCLRSSGIEDFTERWGTLFEGKSRFASFTHQQWVMWVRNHDSNGRWKDWLRYVRERYGYGLA
jgi:hypothetical protein